MYELLILSALMVHDRTGYKLGKILEGNLEPRRQISNGVMYPMLHKLEKAGYITLRN
jgi:DNA-binding PadR family transcriptional regulator